MNVINFPITKSEDIYNDTKEIPIEEIYSTIGLIGDEKVLTSYLKRIYEYEEYTYSLLNDLRYNSWKFRNNVILYSDINNNFILNEYAKLSNFNMNDVSENEIMVFFKQSMDTDTLYSLGDVYGKDNDFLNVSNVESARAVVLTFNNYYIGHVYTWLQSSESHIYVQGIRSSILNIYRQKFNISVKGVGKILIDSIVNYTIKVGRKYINVVQPLRKMAIILEKYGFTPFFYDYIYNVSNHDINKSLHYKLRIIDVIQN